MRINFLIRAPWTNRGHHPWPSRPAIGHSHCSSITVGKPCKSAAQPQPVQLATFAFVAFDAALRHHTHLEPASLTERCRKSGHRACESEVRQQPCWLKALARKPAALLPSRLSLSFHSSQALAGISSLSLPYCIELYLRAATRPARSAFCLSHRRRRWLRKWTGGTSCGCKYALRCLCIRCECAWFRR